MARYCANTYLFVCLCCVNMWKSGTTYSAVVPAAIPLVVKSATYQNPAQPASAATGGRNFAMNDPWREEVVGTTSDSLLTPIPEVQTTKRIVATTNKPTHQDYLKTKSTSALDGPVLLNSVSVMPSTTKVPASRSSSLTTTRAAATSATSGPVNVETTAMPVTATPSQTSMTPAATTTTPVVPWTMAYISETTTEIPILTNSSSESTGTQQGNVDIPESEVFGKLTVTPKKRPSVAYFILRPPRITRRKKGALPRLTDTKRKIDVVVNLN